MTAFTIDITEEARGDLLCYTAFERKTIAAEIRTQLSYEPALETPNRKQLRENPVASWELRVGKFRVFYEVETAARIVSIVAVGHKIHNKVFIRGREVQL